MTIQSFELLFFLALGGRMSKIPSIQPRKTSFDVSNVKPLWNGGDAVMTRFFDALSVNFPDGERFFIQSVRNYQDDISDPKLRQDIRDFIRQEAQHGIVHDKFNEIMEKQGVSVDKIVKNTQTYLGFFQKYMPKKHQLALTAALEHFTATLGEGILENEAVFKDADPIMRALFMWHAIEEVEHKAVAFDVYEEAAGGGYVTRVVALLSATVMVHVLLSPVFWHMLKIDGSNRQPLKIARGLNRFYGRKGFLTRMLPTYLAWFKPGFHPWDTGIPKEVDLWLKEYNKQQDPLAASEAVLGRLNQDTLEQSHAA